MCNCCWCCCCQCIWHIFGVALFQMHIASNQASYSRQKWWVSRDACCLPSNTAIHICAAERGGGLRAPSSSPSVKTFKCFNEANVCQRIERRASAEYSGEENFLALLDNGNVSNRMVGELWVESVHSLVYMRNGFWKSIREWAKGCPTGYRNHLTCATNNADKSHKEFIEFAFGLWCEYYSALGAYVVWRWAFIYNWLISIKWR